MYLVKTPRLLKRLYSQLIWNKSRTNHCIYLTFDDGPIPIVTPYVLNILKQYNAKATFFCIGDNVSKHPDIFEQVKNAGHSIGNHTFNHLKGWKTDDKIYLENFVISFPAFQVIKSMISDAMSCIFHLLKNIRMLAYVIANAEECSLCVVLF